MKQCPECSARYEDGVNFCANDGRSLTGVSAVATRLCPHCANSIAEGAAQCPYCKKDATIAMESSPEWLIREEPTRETNFAALPGGQSWERSRMPKIVLITGIVLCILGASLLGMAMLKDNGAGDTARLLEENIKELQVKEENLKAVEAELVKAREEAAASASKAAENAKEAEALNARLTESQRELAVTQQRLSVVNRELERVSARRAPVEPRIEPRPAERAPAAPRSVRRPAEPGVYETIRATAVHERPAGSSRVISRIGRGTRINVVRSHGDWLEVVSRRGNPPGFVRWDDAMFVRASG